MKLTVDFSPCVTLEVLIASLIAFFTAIGNSAMVSNLFAISFIVIFGFAQLDIHNWRYGQSIVLFLSLCIMNVFINGLFENGRFDFNYLKKVIMFAAFTLFLNAAAREEFYISNITVKIIKILPVLAGTFLAYSYSYMGNTGTVAGAITLGFSNPNFAGMWLLHFFLYGCLFVLEAVNGSKIRLLLIPILIQIWKMVILTQARSCFIGIAAFFVLLILGVRNKKTNKFVLLCIAITPFVFAIIYLSIAYSAWFQQTFNFVISTGKSLTSRVGIWRYALERFWEHPITGNYSGISFGTGQAQMHNTHIDVLCSYGILAAILFVKNLYQNMVAVNDCTDSLYQYAAFCAFCAVIIAGTFEAAIVSGAMGLNLLTVSFLVLAKNGSSYESLGDKYEQFQI